MKPVIVQDWETGKKSGSLEDYHKKGDKEMPPKLNITREEFMAACNEHKTAVAAMKALGMSNACFYKYKKIFEEYLTQTKTTHDFIVALETQLPALRRLPWMFSPEGGIKHGILKTI